MPAREATFEQLSAQLDYQLFIVTTAAAEERSGCLLGFATQTSIRPPRFLVCISRKNHTYRVACRARVLVVHFVPEQATALAELFGGETGDEIDKFAHCDWRPGPDGAPVLTALDSWFAGSVLTHVDLGDHVGFVLAPIAGAASRSERTLTFHRARWIDPGHPA